MEYRQRRLIAAAILAISLIFVSYLVIFSPSETTIPTPTATTMGTGGFWTPIPSSPETEEKRTAEAIAAQAELTEEPEVDAETAADTSRAAAQIPEWMSRISSVPENAACPGTPRRTVEVSSAEEFVDALAAAQPGDRISMAAGPYGRNFELSTSGQSGEEIWICGPRSAVIDSGGPNNGYGLHITGSFVGIWGLTVQNAQKGIVVDGGDSVHIDNVEVRTIGDEAIHFRANATDGIVQDSLIHHIGLRRDTFGEGIYIGSAVSNWPTYTDGEADRSEGILIARNKIWDTTAEAIDIKEGTSDGQVELNSFDGSSMTGADSWVDVKGNGYVIRGNVGTNSPEDGFQTHNIGDMGWGEDNQFIVNTAQVSGPAYGVYIHDADTTNNVVACSNVVIEAASGFSNVECSDAG